MASPRRLWCLLGPWGMLPIVLPPRRAEHDADSIQSNRGSNFVIHVTEAPVVDEQVSNRSDPNFILDSGASYHATSHKLVNLAVSIAAVILTRGGMELPSAGVGAFVSEKFQLPRVLYAPNLAPGTVLVSVQQLAASGYLVMFGGGRCIVRSGSGGKVVGEGRLGDDGLYRLDFLRIPLDDATAADGADSTV